MVSWLVIIALSYLCFAVSSLGDKVVLDGPQNAKSYVFFVGLLNVFAIFLLPFINFQTPRLPIVLLIALDTIVFILGMYFGFEAVEDFEVSKVSATLGALQPILIFFISWAIFGCQELSKSAVFAFLLLIIGSMLISFDKRPQLTSRYLKLIFFSAFFYALDYVLLKLIYTNAHFLSAFVFKSLMLFVFVWIFMIKKENRKIIFAAKRKSKKGLMLRIIFLATQTIGAAANILQSFAISLVPIAFLPIANSLKGLQFVFLFLLTALISVFFPKILKEGLSRRALARKLASIFIIVIGLAFLVF